MTSLAPDSLRPPSALLVDPIVRRALEEDLGRQGDVTTDLIIPSGLHYTARIVGRVPGVAAGLVAAECTFRLVDDSVCFKPAVPDGTAFSANEVLATVTGPARALLTAERVALNLLGHLSGVATATSGLVNAIKDTNARIVCTRKTTPGLRVLEKYAVRCGGGFNHRFGLDDAVLIKDNHIAAAGSLGAAIGRVRNGIGHTMRIEVEVDTRAQLEEALALGSDLILLDNMAPSELLRAVALAKGRALLEASGGVSLATVRSIAETGVDFISSGAITHSAPNLDVALDFA